MLLCNAAGGWLAGPLAQFSHPRAMQAASKTSSSPGKGPFENVWLPQPPPKSLMLAPLQDLRAVLPASGPERSWAASGCGCCCSHSSKSALFCGRYPGRSDRPQLNPAAAFHQHRSYIPAPVACVFWVPDPTKVDQVLGTNLRASNSSRHPPPFGPGKTMGRWQAARLA